MRALLVLGLSLLLFGAGCSDKEGILISTSSDMRAPIYSLSFFVGTDTVATADYFTRAKQKENVIVEGRNLATDPFKLFLTPPSSPEETELLVSDDIFVGVVAYDSEHNAVGYGFSDKLIFVPGKILEWEVSIRDLDRGNGEGFLEIGDCLKWRTGPNTWIHIGGGTDKDCDGASTTDDEFDCDDTNPAIYPDADEICGNLIDDNCNEDTDGEEDADGDLFSPCALDEKDWDCDDTNILIHPEQYSVCGNDAFVCDEPVPTTTVGDRCFATNTNDECRPGLLQCPDSANDGTELFCEITNGPAISNQTCDNYEDCDDPNPLICVEPPVVIGGCVINFHRFGEPGEACLKPNESDTAEVKIPMGPPGCDTYELRNADAFQRWEFTIEYGLGGALCDDASLRVRVRNVESPPTTSPLYVDAMDENGNVIGTYKMDITATSAPAGDCDDASFSCMSANGVDWLPVAVPQN